MATGRLCDCKCLIHQNNLAFLCLVETKLNSLSSDIITSNITLFPSEQSFYNFDTHPGGRILLKWNSSIINFTPSFKDSQIMHGIITQSVGNPMTISCIYAHNTAAERIILQDNLRALAKTVIQPWLVFGDFNCILFSNEKEGVVDPP